MRRGRTKARGNKSQDPLHGIEPFPIIWSAYTPLSLLLAYSATCNSVAPPIQSSAKYSVELGSLG
ncbi:hypothetical protein J6590_011738 [Homalodisca vitripennis]|nr:hypothetical protein J6590_011738 [Homalodisca vitripennis]